MFFKKALIGSLETYSINHPVLTAALAIAVVPVLIVYLTMQKHIIKSLSLGAIV
ncbi:MAG: hypothetical protein WC676_01370 [Candidatus Omnitrophota bacterium]